ncbi:MAG: hypothetical protein AAAFM81_04520 [Pseudomonadota bacterium]
MRRSFLFSIVATVVMLQSCWAEDNDARCSTSASSYILIASFERVAIIDVDDVPDWLPVIIGSYYHVDFQTLKDLCGKNVDSHRVRGLVSAGEWVQPEAGEAYVLLVRRQEDGPDLVGAWTQYEPRTCFSAALIDRDFKMLTTLFPIEAKRGVEPTQRCLGTDERLVGSF